MSGNVMNLQAVIEKRSQACKFFMPSGGSLPGGLLHAHFPDGNAHYDSTLVSHSSFRLYITRRTRILPHGNRIGLYPNVTTLVMRTRGKQQNFLGGKGANNKQKLRFSNPIPAWCKLLCSDPHYGSGNEHGNRSFCCKHYHQHRRDL